MSGSATTPCDRCGRKLAIRFDTDGHGRTVELVEPCGYCERKRRGICQRCHARRVEGTVGRALYCGPCRPAVLRERAKRQRAKRDPLKHAGICTRCESAPVDGTKGRTLYCGPCRVEVRREKDRRRWREDPEHRERKRELRRERREANPEKYRRKKREYRKRRMIRNPQAVIAEQRRTAERPERQEYNRRWAHENQTKYAGPGKAPTCEECGEEVPWTGCGRPMKKCEDCDPKRWEAARKRAEKRAWEEYEERREAA